MAEWNNTRLEPRRSFSRRGFEMEYVGMPFDRDLVGRFVAAICPHCGGWTMFHGEPTRDDVRTEIRNEYVRGNLIVFWRSAASLGPACLQADAPAKQRTCGDAASEDPCSD